MLRKRKIERGNDCGHGKGKLECFYGGEGREKKGHEGKGNEGKKRLG